MSDGVNISIEEYKELIADSNFLSILINSGVDNWEGYDEATAVFDELFEDQEDTP